MSVPPPCADEGVGQGRLQSRDPARRRKRLAAHGA